MKYGKITSMFGKKRHIPEKGNYNQFFLLSLLFLQL